MEGSGVTPPRTRSGAPRPSRRPPQPPFRLSRTHLAQQVPAPGPLHSPLPSEIPGAGSLTHLCQVFLQISPPWRPLLTILSKTACALPPPPGLSSQEHLLPGSSHIQSSCARHAWAMLTLCPTGRTVPCGWQADGRECWRGPPGGLWFSFGPLATCYGLAVSSITKGPTAA